MLVSDTPTDIVASGYDAGVRLGEVIDRDMIAVPVSGEMRLVVVGAPSDFARHPKPAHPRDLAAAVHVSPASEVSSSADRLRRREGILMPVVTAGPRGERGACRNLNRHDL